jgi:hypothetical protein
MNFKIFMFEILKDVIQTKIVFDVEDKFFQILIPSNPLVEIDLLKLNNSNINIVKNSLQKIINNKTYSYKTNLELTNLLNWLISLNTIIVNINS